MNAVEKQLMESRRDALVALFLDRESHQQDSEIKTEEDLYQYLLIDSLVAGGVQTSKVAQAIASLQQYIYQRILNMEPGHPEKLQPSLVNAWQQTDNQYAVWAAEQQIQEYPENFITPITRLRKSYYFGELENTLNQNRLEPTRVQDAVLGYLNQFEAVSNLYVLSGYIDQNDISSAKYYFIGRTNVRPYQYYWRMMDLSLKPENSERITPNCWFDWHSIDLPLGGENILEKTVRPVYYNNRLYVVWVERDPTPKMKADGTPTTEHFYRINFAFKRYDNTWSAPNKAEIATRDANGVITEIVDGKYLTEGGSLKQTDIESIAIVDFAGNIGGQNDQDNAGRLFMGLFKCKVVTGNNKPDAASEFGASFDSAFLSRPITVTDKEFIYAQFKTTKKLQRAVYEKVYAVELVTRGTTDWKDEDKLDHIADLIKDSDVYVDKGFTLKITSKFTKKFESGGGILEVPSDSSLHYAFEGPLEIIFDGSSSYKIYSGYIKKQSKPGSSNLKGISFLYIKNRPGSPATGQTFISDPIYIDENGDIGFFGQPKSNRLNLAGVRIMQSAMNELREVDKGEFHIFQANYSENFYLQSITGFSSIEDKKTWQHNVWRKVGNSNVVMASGAENQNIIIDPDPLMASHEIKLSDFPDANNPEYTVWHGVKGKYNNSHQEIKTAKQFIIKLKYVQAQEFDLPVLKERYDSALGNVQYLDFLKHADLPINTRLNTTFVKTLIKRANIGIESLLSYDIQIEKLEAHLTENNNPQPMDFYGANGLYFWELFFHLPFLVAYRFTAEQQYEQAQNWLHYIFNPSAKNKSDGSPDYWNVRPLVEDGDVTQLLASPTDPDAEAYADPIRYQKAIFLTYVRNLVDQGDAFYRQLTRDGLTAARVRYSQAADLLGLRPDLHIASQWRYDHLDNIARAKNPALREFAEACQKEDVLLILPSTPHSALITLDNDRFVAPINTQLLGYWDTLASRLYNLRHHLTIDGKPMNLPLYEAPLDPAALLSQRAQRGTLLGGVSGALQVILPYRFRAVLPVAHHAVETLMRFGSNLLDMLERGERVTQEVLQQQQLVELSSFTITLQKQALDRVDGDREALLASQAVVKQRCEHYKSLYNQNISDTEQQVMDLHNESRSLALMTDVLQIAGGVASAIPNIYGFAVGGSDWGAPLNAAAMVGRIASQVAGISAQRMEISESYRRRREEWHIQYRQAEGEVAAIEKQLNGLTIIKQSVQTELQHAQAQQDKLQDMLAFMQSRFTQATLYQWLAGQLSALYYQAYDAVLSLCLSVERCWQYENGDFVTRFVQTGGWNDSYRGFLVGETLKLNLHQMEIAYLRRDERRLELTRTVSLKKLGPAYLFDLKRDGKVTFNLTEQLFDQDYPGHYLRQIKWISISLPTLLGPYEDVKALLTQTRSSTILKADIEAVKYLNNPDQGKSENIVTNLRASQQVALSSGLNDSGLFELNLNDERYLPFEGTGVVSSWELEFPNHKFKEQADALAALSDVIVHVHYTALNGGPTFATAVKETLPKPPSRQLVDNRSDKVLSFDSTKQPESGEL